MATTRILEWLGRALHLAAARLPLSADHHHGADVVQRLAVLPAAVRMDDGLVRLAVAATTS